MQPVKLSCEDHEGGGMVFIQQWDGEKWVSTGDAISPMREFVRGMIEESAANYAKEAGITLRDCK